jgi:hypothetical protein
MDFQTTHNEKYHYHRFLHVLGGWQWCYSARDFQKQLNQRVKDLVLEKLYISFDEYIDGKCYDRSHFDLAFEGGYVLLVFNKLAVKFAIHVEGMVEYGFFSPEEINIEEIYDYEPDRYDQVYTNVVELQDCFDAEYAGKRVIKAEVRHTNMWGFRLEGFNKEQANRAAAANDLPERICFYLANGVIVQLICDDLEYFHIVVEKSALS